MQNLKWHHKASGDTLRYRTQPLGDIVEVEVRYEDGKGMLNRETFQKGIKVSITPRRVDPTEDPNVNIERAWLYGPAKRSGRKIHVKTLKRKSDTALLMVAEMLDPHVVTIAAKFLEGDGMSAFDLINDIFAPPVEV